MIWTNKRFGKKTFTAHYKYDANNERVIEFKCREKAMRKTYESFVAAKNDGWRKK